MDILEHGESSGVIMLLVYHLTLQGRQYHVVRKNSFRVRGIPLIRSSNALCGLGWGWTKQRERDKIEQETKCDESSFSISAVM